MPESWLKFWLGSRSHPVLLCTQSEQHEEEKRDSSAAKTHLGGKRSTGAWCSFTKAVLQMLANPWQESLFLHCSVSSGIKKPETGILSPGRRRETTGNHRDSSMCQHCPVEPSRTTRSEWAGRVFVPPLGEQQRRKELYLRCHSRLSLGRLWLLWA